MKSGIAIIAEQIITIFDRIFYRERLNCIMLYMCEKERAGILCLIDIESDFNLY